MGTRSALNRATKTLKNILRYIGNFHKLSDDIFTSFMLILSTLISLILLQLLFSDLYTEILKIYCNRSSANIKYK